MIELTKSELPMWDESMGYFREYDPQDNYAYWFMEAAFIFCQNKRSSYDNETVIGFVINKEYEKRQELKEKGNALHKHGWQGHRNGVVPCIHKSKNFVRSRKIHGIMKEYKDNLSCEESYKSFDGLVRASRKVSIFDYTAWRDCYDPSRGTRCWKRSKKRKQWM